MYHYIPTLPEIVSHVHVYIIIYTGASEFVIATIRWGSLRLVSSTVTYMYHIALNVSRHDEYTCTELISVVGHQHHTQVVSRL